MAYYLLSDGEVSYVASALREKMGRDRVLASDLRRAPKDQLSEQLAEAFDAQAALLASLADRLEGVEETDEMRLSDAQTVARPRVSRGV